MYYILPYPKYISTTNTTDYKISPYSSQPHLNQKQTFTQGIGINNHPHKKILAGLLPRPLDPNFSFPSSVESSIIRHRHMHTQEGGSVRHPQATHRHPPHQPRAGLSRGQRESATLSHPTIMRLWPSNGRKRRGKRASVKRCGQSGGPEHRRGAADGRR